MTNDTFLNSTVLRQRAEDKLDKIADKFDNFSLKDIKTIIHEIQVHQIELEMQNEELMSSQQRLKESEIKYYEFYNNAPVGFMTLNEEGKIIEANLRCAELLGYDKE